MRPSSTESTYPHTFIVDRRQGPPLADLCRTQGRSVSDVCREALRLYLATPVDPLGVRPKGRPELVRMTVAMDPTLRPALDARAAEVGRSISWICRQAITRYLSAPPTLDVSPSRRRGK